MGVPLRLLMIEDSEDDAALIVRELSRGGYDVDFLRVDSPEAINSAMDQQRWDLIISDYSMPRFNGTDALLLARGKELAVPFIFVSGTIGEETAVSALKMGAQDYLMKDNLRRLTPAVQRELREVNRSRERSQLEQQVWQLRKFEAIGRLAGGIAHDFNNVLGAILGLAEMGYGEERLDDRSRERFRKIRDHARKASGLTAQLLAFARRQILQPRNINLNHLVQETVSLLGNIIGEHITIKTVLDDDLCVIRADATQLEQVLMNLCLNGRDAMPNGGILGIETKGLDISGADFSIPADILPGKYAMLTVSDTGAGMDAATVEHLFEPFFTTKAPGKGTGLGLSTVYGVVRQHNGSVTVDSTPGKGTTFRVFLPASNALEEEDTREHEAPVRGGTETILLAEDHPGLREVTSEILSGFGYKVIAASNGTEAVRLFQENSRDIHLVLLDITMPEMDGPQAYLQLLTMNPDLRAVFTSGYTEERARLTELLEAGAVFLQKPYSPEALARTVRDLIDAK